MTIKGMGCAAKVWDPNPRPCTQGATKEVWYEGRKVHVCATHAAQYRTWQRQGVASRSAQLQWGWLTPSARVRSHR